VIVLYPTQTTFAAYTIVLRDSRLPPAFWVSVIRTVAGTSLTLAFTTVGAYVVSKKRLPGRSIFIFLILVTILVGGGLIPSFIVMLRLKLINSIWALILPGLVDSWGLLVIKQYFEGIPDSLEEAAYSDGATEIQYFLRIALPNSIPVLAAIGLFNAVGHWNSWFDALMYITDNTKMPLQLFLRNLLAGVTFTASMTSGGSGPSLQIPSTDAIKMALVVVATVPILCVYPFLQRHFIKGVFLGAVKG